MILVGSSLRRGFQYPRGSFVRGGSSTDTIFTVPEGVFSISAVAIGTGGRGGVTLDNTISAPGGGGGALAYSNNISVTPGEILNVIIRRNLDEERESSQIVRASNDEILLLAENGGDFDGIFGGGRGRASQSVGDVRHNGGEGGDGHQVNETAAGAGGAGGYSGPGGDGANSDDPTGTTTATDGSGGAAGGGGLATNQAGGGGGGTGLFGEGASGVAGPNITSTFDDSGGGGGSGGDDGGNSSGGEYGGGRGGRAPNQSQSTGLVGAWGGIRIIWGSPSRGFPNNAG